MYVFFCQAEDGIRDGHVTGVQTCALPISSDNCVLLYPEGTLTKDPELWPMSGKTGAARLALLTSAPVVPVAQWGAQAILPPKRKFLRILPRKTVQVLAGSRIELRE